MCTNICMGELSPINRGEKKIVVRTLVKEFVHKESIVEQNLESQINDFIEEMETTYPESFRILDIKYSICTKNVDAVRAIRGALITYTLVLEK